MRAGCARSRPAARASRRRPSCAARGWRAHLTHTQHDQQRHPPGRTVAAKRTGGDARHTPRPSDVAGAGMRSVAPTACRVRPCWSVLRGRHGRAELATHGTGQAGRGVHVAPKAYRQYSPLQHAGARTCTFTAPSTPPPPETRRQARRSSRPGRRRARRTSATARRAPSLIPLPICFRRRRHAAPVGRPPQRGAGWSSTSASPRNARATPQ
jgi:hypothetical protein